MNDIVFCGAAWLLVVIAGGSVFKSGRGSPA
jgi:hypothetical protein